MDESYYAQFLSSQRAGLKEEARTAIQRFVKVWRQATPERPRRTRHHRGSGTEEPRAGSLAQWWAAHRPQTESTGRSGSASRRR